MSIIDSVKNTAFSTAVKTVMDYLEKDPEKNIPKAMSMMDKVLPDGWGGMRDSGLHFVKQSQKKGTGIS